MAHARPRSGPGAAHWQRPPLAAAWRSNARDSAWPSRYACLNGWWVAREVGRSAQGAGERPRRKRHCSWRLVGSERYSNKTCVSPRGGIAFGSYVYVEKYDSLYVGLLLGSRSATFVAFRERSRVFPVGLCSWRLVDGGGGWVVRGWWWATASGRADG